LMRSTMGSGAALTGGAGSALTDAIKSGDTVRARAARNILANSGGKGLDTMASAIHAAERDGANHDTLQKLRSDVNASGIKSKHAVLAAWGVGNTTMAASTQGAFDGLSAEEIASQTKGSLVDGRDSRGLSQTAAAETLANADLVAKMGPDERAILSQIVAGP